MGLRRDMANRVKQVRVYLAEQVESARNYIYNLGRPITGTNVQNLLKETSGVPTVVSFVPPFMPQFLIPLQNAFVARLGCNFDPSRMLVVDLLHEFELGVWKTLFTLLIRLLYVAGKNGSESLVAELDLRFLQDFCDVVDC